jgi:hypothetical protein
MRDGIFVGVCIVEGKDVSSVGAGGIWTVHVIVKWGGEMEMIPSSTEFFSPVSLILRFMKSKTRRRYVPEGVRARVGDCMALPHKRSRDGTMSIRHRIGTSNDQPS